MAISDGYEYCPDCNEAVDEFIRKLAARFLPAEEPANGGA